jgi:hypothetical protein
MNVWNRAEKWIRQEGVNGMDLKVYYAKIRSLQATLAEEFPIVVSRETGDGGKAGTLTEVSRALAAKLVVDRVAELASEEAAKAFRARQAEAKAKADQLAEANKVQLTVLPLKELERLQGSRKTKE